MLESLRPSGRVAPRGRALIRTRLFPTPRTPPDHQRTQRRRRGVLPRRDLPSRHAQAGPHVTTRAASRQSVDRLLGAPRRPLRTGHVLRAGRSGARCTRRSCGRSPRRDTRSRCHGDRHEDRLSSRPLTNSAPISGGPRRGSRTLSASRSSATGRRTSRSASAQAWAYQILLEEGFRYDSSLYPILHDRYGQPSAPRFPYEICRDGSAALMEFPIGTAPASRREPSDRRGRLLPASARAVAVSASPHVNTAERRPVMFYLHPWELDPDQPRPRWRGTIGSVTTWASRRRWPSFPRCSPGSRSLPPPRCCARPRGAGPSAGRGGPRRGGVTRAVTTAILTTSAFSVSGAGRRTLPRRGRKRWRASAARVSPTRRSGPRSSARRMDTIRST